MSPLTSPFMGTVRHSKLTESWQRQQVEIAIGRPITPADDTSFTCRQRAAEILLPPGDPIRESYEPTIL